jgi:hypothetical protein
MSIGSVLLHAAEPFVPVTSPFEVEIAIANLENYEFSGSDQIPQGLIQTGRETH